MNIFSIVISFLILSIGIYFIRRDKKNRERLQNEFCLENVRYNILNKNK